MLVMTAAERKAFIANNSHRYGLEAAPDKLFEYVLYADLADAGRARSFTSNLNISILTAGGEAVHLYEGCSSLAKVKRSYRIRSGRVKAARLEKQLCKQCARKGEADPDVLNAVRWSRLAVLDEQLARAESVVSRAGKLTSYYTRSQAASDAQQAFNLLEQARDRVLDPGFDPVLAKQVKTRASAGLDLLADLGVDDTLERSRYGLCAASVLVCGSDRMGNLLGAPTCSAFSGVPTTRTPPVGREVRNTVLSGLLGRQRDTDPVELAEQAFATLLAAGPAGWEQLPGQLASSAPADGQSVAEWMHANWEAEFISTQTDWIRYFKFILDSTLSQPAPPLKVSLKVQYGEGENALRQIQDLISFFNPQVSADGKVSYAVVPAAVAGACITYSANLGKGVTFKVEPIVKEHAELVRTALAMFEPRTDAALNQLPAAFTTVVDMLEVDMTAILALVPPEYSGFPGVANTATPSCPTLF